MGSDKFLKMKNNLSKNFEIVLKNFKIGYFSGICSAISASDISIKEKLKLEKFFNKNKPCFYRHREFYNHPQFIGLCFWWERDPYNPDISKEQRILFLEKMVRITKEVSWYKAIFRWLHLM